MLSPEAPSPTPALDAEGRFRGIQSEFAARFIVVAIHDTAKPARRQMFAGSMVPGMSDLVSLVPFNRIELLSRRSGRVNEGTKKYVFYWPSRHN